MIQRGLLLVARVQSHPFVRQIGGMMALTAIGQGMYMLAGPFIGRIYSPEQIGYFGLFITIWTSLALFACGLYDLAIPGAHTDEEAQRLSGASILLGIGLGVASGAAVSFFTAQGWWGLGIFPLWVGAVIAAGMLVQMVVLIAQAWAVRRNEVMVIGRANVVMNGLRGLFQVLGGLLSPLWAMMAVSEIVARAIQARQMANSGVAPKSRMIRWDDVDGAIRRNRRFPLIFGPVAVIDSIATLLQTAMIGLLFGPTAMGQFFLMRRTLDLPVAFAFRSLSDLFFARQLTLAREAPQRLRSFFLRSSAMLAVIGVIGGAPLMIWSRQLFEIFYGPNWAVAGMLAAVTVPAMIANLAVAPVARVFQLSNKAYLRLVPGVVNLSGSILVLWFADSYKLSLMQTTVAISVVIGVQYLAYFIAGIVAAGSIRANEPALARTLDR